jgi:hypothetical protein
VVLSASPDSIRVIVPAEATTGPVTVTSGNGTATSPLSFTVLGRQGRSPSIDGAASGPALRTDFSPG